MATLVVNKLRGILERLCGQGTRLRRPPQSDARRHCHVDRRQGDLQGPGHRAGPAVKLPDLGKAKKVDHSRKHDHRRGGGGRKTRSQGRAEQIRAEDRNTDSEYDREKLQERLAKLAGGVAQINCRRRDRNRNERTQGVVEDAKSATQAALEEGIVPGGGVALIRAKRRSTKLKLDRR